MNKETFQEWMENEVTQWVMHYLTDSAKEEREIISEAIFNGAIIPENEQISKSAICATLIRISELEFEEIEEFYNEKE